MISKPYYFNILFLFFIFLLGCDKKQKEDIQLDFTHIENFDEAFSLRFTGTDTVLIRQYWTANNLSGTSKNYIAILDDSQKDQISELIKGVKILELDTIYPKSSVPDGSFMGMFLQNNLQQALFYPNHRHESKEVRRLIEYISDTKKMLELISADHQTDFKSAPKIPAVMDKTSTSKFLPAGTP